MSTTILTDKQIMACLVNLAETTKSVGIGNLYLKGDAIPIGRAIEQAVLQSPEVQAWKRDAERYRATRAGLVGTDPDYGSRFCEYCDEMGIKQAENITEEQFDAATDAAMEKQK